MPNHCCTIWNGESCRTNFAATKQHPFEGGTVYRFPRDLEEQSRWEMSLPNKLKSAKNPDGTYKKHVVICYKHFPPNVVTKVQPGGSVVPTEPPSIFGSTSSSFFAQTVSPVQREPEKRNVTAEARSERFEEQLVDEDLIVDFDHLVSHCFNEYYGKLFVNKSNGTLKISKLDDESPPDLKYCLVIHDDFKVEAFRGRKKIATRDIVDGFTCQLSRYSQIGAILDRLESTPLDIRSELRACGAKILDLANEIDDDDDAARKRRMTFTGKQILLLHKRSYSSDDMLDAINLYLRSRNSYRALRELLVLPCSNVVRDYFGKYGLTGGANECKSAVNNVFNALNDGEKDCFLSFDEIHIKPGLGYQGKYVMGNAFNTSEPTPANCMLAVMVNPSYGAPAFVARLVPVKNLKADFLFGIIQSVLEVIHDAGGRVFSLMCDDLSVNQKTYKMFHETYDSLGIASISHPHKNSKFDTLFTLFDPTHLFKNIRNNWCTEKNQTLQFKDPETKKTFVAKWSDLRKIYKEETDGSILRETKLDYTTLHPNNFEKQKVQLVVNIFNEKTVAKLQGRNEMIGTYTFVKLVTRMWNILNTKSPESAKRLNDPDREKFTDCQDSRLDFILRMATMFKEMDNSIRGQRVKGLTGETANALHQTLVGMVDLIRLLLEKGHSYVLPGKFSSDRIEAEFGLCRASGGGNYLIGAEQVINSVKLQRLKLYTKLDVDIDSNDSVIDDCCTFDLLDSEQDLDLIDGCFADTENLTVSERSSLYYICGYVAFKERIICQDADDEIDLPKEAEFTMNVSRGKLKLPPINLYDFSQYCYCFFKARKNKCCTKIYLEAFSMIYDFTNYSFENVNSIARRLCNCFFKAFVKKETDSLKAQRDTRQTKKLRLSAKD